MTNVFGYTYETSRGQIQFSVTDWTYRSLLYKFLSSTDFWILIFANEEWISKGICNPSGRTEERESENCPYTITGLHHSQTPKKWSAQRNVNLIFYDYKKDWMIPVHIRNGHSANWSVSKNNVHRQIQLQQRWSRMSVSRVRDTVFRSFSQAWRNKSNLLIDTQVCV